MLGVSLTITGSFVCCLHHCATMVMYSGTWPTAEPEVETILDMIAAEKKGEFVLEVPLGFTCDHLETLYDIDIVHRRHAERLGLTFERAESLNTSPFFIKALADIVKKA